MATGRTNNYVCLDCHTAASRQVYWGNREQRAPRCPRCTAPMDGIGNAPVPPKRDKRGWRVLLARVLRLTAWKRQRELAARPKPPLGRPIYRYRCEVEAA